MKLSCKYFVVAIVLLTALASAQISTGTPPFGSFGGGPFDTVNLGNLNVHFTIPILHKAGRGVPFVYDLSYDSSIWYQGTSGGTTQWTPTANWGWTSNSYAVLGNVGTSTTSQFQFSGKICPNSQYGSQYLDTTTYTYIDSRKRSHPFPGATTKTVVSGACNITNYGSALTSQSSDGSGYTLYAPANQVGITVTTRSGHVVSWSNGGTYTDNNGNQLTVNNSTGQYFDTSSSSTAVLTQSGSGTSSSPIKYTYAAPSGNNFYTVNYTDYTVATSFGFSGTIAEYGPVKNALVSSILLPDGTSYTFTYEATPGSCTPLSGTSSCVTGRINEVILPTGGAITYTYSGGTHGTGIYTDGSTSALSRKVAPGGSGQTGTWSYTRNLVSGSPAPGSTWTTTIDDPAGNQTVVNFAEDSTVTNTSSTPPTTATYNFYETQRQAYQGTVSGNSCSSTITNNCLVATSIRCYNLHYSNCSTATVSSPITQTDSYRQLLNGSTALSEIVYNGAGLVTDDKEYGYGVALNAAPSSTYLVRETVTNYASLGNGIVNRPATIVIKDWTASGNVLSSTTYSYDGATVVGSTGTPQHISITGSRGNLTTLATEASSSTTLYRQFTYYDTGMPNNSTGVDLSSSTTCTSKPSICTTYHYSSATASCGNAFPTSISEPLSLSRSTTWNCTGAVATQVTDETGNNVSSTYSDPDFWRPASVTDQMTNVTNLTYTGQIAVEGSLNFNGGSSTSDSLATVDGFGRPIFSQRLQAPSSTNYDTKETDYNSLGQPYRSTMPYTAGASPSTNNTTVAATTKTFDALGRVLTITDGSSGTVMYTYTNNDVLQQVGGPSGTQAFQKQFEYDGLGRLTSVCEISSSLPNTGTCGQGTPQTGYWTKYTYDALGHLLTVVQNAQATSEVPPFAVPISMLVLG